MFYNIYPSYINWNGRGNGWKMVIKFSNFINQINSGLLPTAEFRGVNFTIDWALSKIT